MKVRELCAALSLWLAACQSDGERGPRAPAVARESHGGPLGTPSQRAATRRTLAAVAGVVASRLAAAEQRERSSSRAEREYARLSAHDARQAIEALRALGVEARPAPPKTGARLTEEEAMTALAGVASEGARAAEDVASGNVLRMIADDAERAARFLSAQRP